MAAADCWQSLWGRAVILPWFQSSPTGAVEIELAGPPEAELQVTVFRSVTDLPRLDLAVNNDSRAGRRDSIRGAVKERNGVPVRLSALAWEPLTPSANPHSNGFRCGRLDMLGIAAALGPRPFRPAAS